MLFVQSKSLKATLLKSQSNKGFRKGESPTKKRFCLTLSWRRPLSYRNQSIDLLSKSMDWLYDNGLCHERVKIKFAPPKIFK